MTPMDDDYVRSCATMFSLEHVVVCLDATNILAFVICLEVFLKRTRKAKCKYNIQINIDWRMKQFLSYLA